MRNKFSPQKKLEILEKVVKQGKSVVEVCQNYKISRKTFYQWKKRYQEDLSPEKNLQNLKNRSTSPKKYTRLSSKRLVSQVLNVVKKHPEYSYRKVSAVLNQKADK